MRRAHIALAVLAIAGIPAAQLQAQETHQEHEGTSMKDHMDDDPKTLLLRLDQLEVRESDGSGLLAWDAKAWYGGDRNRLYLRTEGQIVSSTHDEITVEGFWVHPISRWWNLALGARQDFEPNSRGWVALGVIGLLPYQIDTQATGYFGNGRIAFRFEMDYDLLLTNRLILQPRLEFNAYGDDGKAIDDGDGHVHEFDGGSTGVDLELRLRYEIRREFAPYVGLAWVSRHGHVGNIDLAGSSGHELQALAGVRAWF